MAVRLCNDGVAHSRRWVGRAYQDAPGQPLAANQAAFDIISTDVDSLTSEAEALLILDDILRALPGAETQSYDIHISHSYCGFFRISY